MPRTKEQKEADEALREALVGVTAAYYGDMQLGILTDFIVIAAYAGFDEDGDDESHVMLHPAEGSMPMYKIMGLLQYSKAREDAAVMGVGDDGREDGD